MSVSIVTGAARGIGAQVATELASEGRQVLLVDQNPQVEQTAASIDAHAVCADITDPAGRARIAEAAEATGEALTLLVNNAGITRDAMVHKMTQEQFRSVVNVNLGGTYALTVQLADQIADGASVVNLSSRAQLGNVGQFNYAVSKAGVIGCTRALALQYAPRLRVNAVAPGFIESEMTAAMPENVKERVIASVPLARAGRPADIAGTIRWLASPAAGYVTGQVIYVCGGRSFG